MEFTLEGVGGQNHYITIKNVQAGWLQLIIGRPDADRTSIELGIGKNQAFALSGALLAVGSQIKD